MIAAICSAHEEPWLAETIQHHYAQGCDIVIVSTPHLDDTMLTAVDNDAYWYQQYGPFRQDDEMTRLANIAMSKGATWVVPFDADEYWIDPTREQTVAQVLAAQPPHITRIYAAMFTMLDYDRKVPDQKPFGKVAFRPHPAMRLSWGQHDIYLPDGEAAHGLLEVREIQYRDREHWDAKIDKARRLFATGAVPTQYGGHMRMLCDATPEELDTLWRIYQDIPTITDPITR